MKKIPTLFHREFDNHKVVAITPEVTPGFEWVLDGEGEATVKVDGACCAIIDGKFYKRYDAKKNKKGEFKKPPEGAIPCDDPDPVTGHWPHWVEVSENNPDDHWFIEAYKFSQDLFAEPLHDGTYEAVGKHFNGNPYEFNHDELIGHGTIPAALTGRSFEDIRDYLENVEVEGIVFWKDGQPQCKIKRTDFGFEWPIKPAK